ncbi:putative SV2-like protein 1 [Operophtera brumata]|uniref:Putative SV2-like protein 1 n=1 Tax=Operophtera brumata TaxID=104452 RepID=A0A0L7KRD9_OPEBR|nr:putative SV2-like protein 1 [Operophtera brumata]
MVILTGANCEFNLDLSQTSTLLTVTFIGPIVMAYPWGYLSDTQGRKRCLLISLWSSYLVSTASAFSPNWITMATLKLISTSFASCAQSATYTLLGESCPKRMRDAYMLIMTSILDFSLAVYVGIAYFILNLEFSYDLGFITFSPWRLLTMTLALPLGIGAFGLHFFYESPRFLHNAGKEEEAMDALRGIWSRNGGGAENYPVRKIFLNEEGNERSKDISIFRSLWEQIVPLFKPPLLWRSLQLYFITLVVYGTLFYTSLVQGLTFVMVLLSVTRFAHKKRLLVITILSISGVCAALAVVVKENITSFIMFFGLLLNELIIGVIFSSALGGVSLLGAFIMTHCDVTFYVCAAIMFCEYRLLLPGRSVPSRSLHHDTL